MVTAKSVSSDQINKANAPRIAKRPMFATVVDAPLVELVLAGLAELPVLAPVGFEVTPETAEPDTEPEPEAETEAVAEELAADDVVCKKDRRKKIINKCLNQ